MWIRLLTIITLLMGLMLLVCKVPTPPPGPEDSFVALEYRSSGGKITKDTLTDTTGKQVKICLIHNLTQYIDSSILKITKGTDFNEVHEVRSFKGQTDTTYYPIVFSVPGSYAVIFIGYIQGQPKVLNGTITIVDGQPITQNHKPVINLSREIKTGAGQELFFPVSATDPDANQQVTISVVKKPESATFNSNLFRWTPAMTDTGSVDVIFTATDNGSPALSTTDTCVIVVSATPVNRAPQWSIISIQQSARPDVLFSMDLSSYSMDPDNDNLTFSLLQEVPANDAIVGTMYQLTPTVSDVGEHSIHIVVSDPAGLSDTLTLELIISKTITSKPDIVPPVITLRSPAKDTSISTDSCEVKVTCVDDSGCTVKGYCDGIAFEMKQVSSVQNLWTGLVKGLKIGTYSTIKIVATDSSAAKNSDSAFVRVIWSKIATYALTINATNGSVSKSPDAATYDSGTVVTLTPVPENNYHFTGWSGALTGSANPTTVIMNSAKTVTAGFEINPPNMFALTVVASNGIVKKTPDLPMYESGSTVGLKATAATGYHFVKWTGDASGTSDSIQVQMTDAKSLAANFEINNYQLTIAAGTGGSIAVPLTSPASVNHGVATTITAAANTGYNFSGWTVSGPASVTDPGSPTTTIALTGDATVTANFTLKTYSLTIVAGTGGSITAPASSPATVNHEAATTITAVANSGYSFSGWTVSGSGKVADSTLPNTTIALTGNAKVTANFTQKTYTLTVSAGTGGSITTPKNSPVTVNHGIVTTITAAANDGYDFSGWTVNGSAVVADSTLANTTITLTGNTTVTAKFTQKTYSLTVTAGTGGSISVPANSPVNVIQGAATTITATANPGYSFSGWTVTGSATIASSGSENTTITLTGNATVTANFTQKTYSLTVTAGTGGSISLPANSPVTVNHGVATPITAAANQGFSFSGWVVTGSATVATPSSENTTITLTGNATVTANFTQKTYSLTVKAGTGGSITAPTGSFPKTVASGAATTITASTSENYIFSGWTISPNTAGTITDPESATTTVALTGDATVTANFSLKTFQLTVLAATGGSITAPTGTFPRTVNSGESTTITASANSSYNFAGWTVTAGTATIAAPTQASTTVKLTSEGATVRANFTIKTYSLSVKTTNGGSVTEPSSSPITVNHGTKTLIQATAKSGYEFSSWSVTSGTASIDAPGSFSTNVALTSGDATVTANFSCVPITVTTSTSKTECNNAWTYFYVTNTSGGGTGRLYYTWQRNGVNISEGANFKGTKTGTLEVLANSSTAGSYTCVVDNGVGCSASSAAVTLSIKSASLVIRNQPSSQTLEPNGIAPIDVSVSGGSGVYSYQWYFNGAPFNNTYPTHTGTGTAVLDYVFGTDCSNGEYYCVITDNDGVTCPITTTPFTITTSGPCN